MTTPPRKPATKKVTDKAPATSPAPKATKAKTPPVASAIDKTQSLEQKVTFRFSGRVIDILKEQIEKAAALGLKPSRQAIITEAIIGYYGHPTFCGSCGTEAKPGDFYCGNCGAALRDNRATQ